MRTRAALRHPARTFNVTSSVNDSGALIVSYDEATGRRVLRPSGQPLALEAQKLTSPEAASAASPAVWATDSL
jgi:hypothetical protein